MISYILHIWYSISTQTLATLGHTECTCNSSNIQHWKDCCLLALCQSPSQHQRNNVPISGQPRWFSTAYKWEPSHTFDGL